MGEGWLHEPLSQNHLLHVSWSYMSWKGALRITEYPCLHPAPPKTQTLVSLHLGLCWVFVLQVSSGTAHPLGIPPAYDLLMCCLKNSPSNTAACTKLDIPFPFQNVDVGFLSLQPSASDGFSFLPVANCDLISAFILPGLEKTLYFFLQVFSLHRAER